MWFHYDTFVYIYIYILIYSPPTLITQLLSMFLYLHNFMLELFMNISFFSFIPFQLHPHSLPPLPHCKLLLTFWNLFWLLPALIQLPTVCVYYNTSGEERKNEGKKAKKKIKERLRKYHNSFRVQMRSLIILHK